MQHGYKHLGLAFAAALALAGCGGKILDWRNAQVSKGQVYEGAENRPFSGRITNIPLNKVYGTQPGYQELIGNANALIGALFGSALLCDAEFDDGLPNGKISCKEPGAKSDQINGFFEKGVMSGEFSMHDRSTNNLTLEARFNNGQLDGELKRFEPTTGKPVSLETMSNGSFNGPYKRWNLSSGEVLESSDFANGVRVGDYVLKDQKGDILRSGTYTDGKYSGSEFVSMKHEIESGKTYILSRFEKKYEFDKFQNEKEFAVAQSSADRISGCIRDFESAYRLNNTHFASAAEMDPIVEKCKTTALMAQSNVAQAAAPRDTTTIAGDRTTWPNESNTCTTSWEAAFHNEKGEDAPISYDQAWEFVDNCRSGKSPQRR